MHTCGWDANSALVKHCNITGRSSVTSESLEFERRPLFDDTPKGFLYQTDRFPFAPSALKHEGEWNRIRNRGWLTHGFLIAVGAYHCYSRVSIPPGTVIRLTSDGQGIIVTRSVIGAAAATTKSRR